MYMRLEREDSKVIKKRKWKQLDNMICYEINRIFSFICQVHCLHIQLQVGGSKFSARTPAGRWFNAATDTLPFTLIKCCDLLISVSSITLTFRLIPFHYNADTLSLKPLAVVSNYWCQPDSQGPRDLRLTVPAVGLAESLWRSVSVIIKKLVRKHGRQTCEESRGELSGDYNHLLQKKLHNGQGTHQDQRYWGSWVS